MASICGSPVCAGGKPKLKFTYTGDYVVRKDGVVELLTSGTIVFLEPKVIDVFMVGGGGAGRTEYVGAITDGSGGGGGGYTRTIKRLAINGNSQLLVTIGAGGNYATFSGSGKGGPGGASAFGDFTVNGGNAGGTETGGNAAGGSGGSGGGAGVSSSSDYGSGGSDGNNGEKGNDTGTKRGGVGQHFTTREFGESTGKLYAGGGGGGRYMSAQIPVVSSGGAGGGGSGAWVNANGTNNQAAAAGIANTGGGGGGGANTYTGATISIPGASGGSGIVCFREAVELPELAGTWVLNERLYPSQTGASINEVISYQGVTPQGNFTGYSIGIGATANATVAFYLNASTNYAQYQFSSNTWVVSKPSPVQTITFPAGATASDEFRAWLASNATKQA